MMEELFDKLIYSIIKIIIGFLILIILFKIINFISKKFESKLVKNPKVDITISRFISPLLNKGLKFFVIVLYIGFIGIETSSIAAAITSAGLAIGLAMQGALSNFAGGFIILITRPFKVGDYIDVLNVSGSVESIEIFYTTLITPDNKVIKIPNGEVASNTIVDYSLKDIRRIDLIIPISYKNDFDFVKKVVNDSLNKMKLILKNKGIFVGINKYNATNIELEIRLWCKTRDYWELYYKVIENIFFEFRNSDIDMPFSQTNINITNKSV